MLDWNAVYRVKINGKWTEVRAVDGEQRFQEPGRSHGWVHFAHPVTGAKLGFAGVTWFEEHAVKL